MFPHEIGTYLSKPEFDYYVVEGMKQAFTPDFKHVEEPSFMPLPMDFESIFITEDKVEEINKKLQNYVTNINIEQLIEDLRGTCQSLDEAISNQNENCNSFCLTSDQLEQIDSELFQCESCGWWCEISEQAEQSSDGITDFDDVCVDCIAWKRKNKPKLNI